MQSLGHAFVKTHAPTSRLRSLIQELQAHGCRLPLVQQESRIDFDPSDCTLEWFAEGGIDELFGRYADVAVRCPDLLEPAGR